MKKYVFYFLLILFSASCGTSSLGYFEVEPSMSSFNKSDETLYIDFGRDVKNNLSIDRCGITTLNVREFKQSLRYALTEALSHQFKGVEFYSGEQKGFVLKVNLMKSSWLVGRKREIIRKGFNDTLLVHDFACFLRYASVLYHNKVQVSDISGDVRVRPDDTRIWRLDNLFQQAVKLSCEDMAKKISERKD